MAEICISSDVTVDHILVNFSTLSKLNSVFNLYSLKDDVWFSRFENNDLFEIQDQLLTLVDNLLKRRVPITSATDTILSGGRELKFKKTSIINVSYKGNNIMLDFRNNEDFEVCVLINLHSLIKEVLLRKGTLYVYNRCEIDKINGVKIISLLHAKHNLSIGELEAELKQSTKGEDFSKIYASLYDDILLLEKKYGLLYIDEYSKEYKLTGRGYMFW